MHRIITNILWITFGFAQVSLAQNGMSFQLANPILTADSVFFIASAEVDMELDMEGVRIHYTTNGEIPDESDSLFNEVIQVTTSMEIKAIAFHEECVASEVSTLRLFKTKTITCTEASVSPLPDKRYAGEGVSSLMDQQKGSLNFKAGKWLGVAFKDMEVVYKFFNPIEINGITVSVLSDPNSWIFPPTGIEIYTSEDGELFQSLATCNTSVLSKMERPNLKFQNCDCVPSTTTYLKVIIKNTGTMPEWHLRAGKGSWLFVDELIIK